MFLPRLIPVLLLKERGFYKGVKFKKHKYVGDPFNIIKIFNEKEVDEIVIFDIEARTKGIDFEYLKDIATEAFLPLSYGGGIKTIDDIDKIFSIGFEKVVLNTAFIETPELIREAAQKYGSQSIVVTADIKKSILFKKYMCYISNATKKTNIEIHDYIAMCEEAGVGEIIVNFIDFDGTGIGMDYDFIEYISKMTSVPVVFAGGIGSLEHCIEALKSGASAVGAGSFFVYQGTHRAVMINYPGWKKLKEKLGDFNE